MKITVTILLLSILFYAGNASADLTTGIVITNVGADTRNNALVSVELSKDIKNGACERNNVVYLDPADATQKALIAVAITSRVTGTEVVIIDDGLCGETFNGKTVSRISLMKG